MKTRGDNEELLVTFGDFLRPGLPALGLYHTETSLGGQAILLNKALTAPGRHDRGCGCD